MKVIILALIVFFLQVSVSIVDVLDIYQSNIVTVGENQWITEVESAQSDVYDPSAAVDVATSFGFGDFVNGFLRFRDMFYRVVNVKATLVLFGVDSAIAGLVGLGTIILWILGVAQFISNRATKGMQ